MKKRKKTATPVARHRRFSMPTLTIAALVVAAAAITVVSKQLASNKVTATTQTAQTAQAVAPASGKKYVTVKVAGRDVQVDPQTGKIKPLTPEEARQLADGLKTMLNKSTDGLEQVQNADGSVSMDLKGRFQNVAVARVNDDGSVEESCIDEPQQAARFFGIDPKLLGVEPVKGAAQPIIKTPARKVSQ
jgi:hypothetical protein